MFPLLVFLYFFFFFFNDTATTEIYTLSLHDAIEISSLPRCELQRQLPPVHGERQLDRSDRFDAVDCGIHGRDVLHADGTARTARERDLRGSVWRTCQDARRCGRQYDAHRVGRAERIQVRVLVQDAIEETVASALLDAELIEGNGYFDVAALPRRQDGRDGITFIQSGQ